MGVVVVGVVVSVVLAGVVTAETTHIQDALHSILYLHRIHRVRYPQSHRYYSLRDQRCSFHTQL